MKKLYLLNILIFLTVFTAPISADNNPSAMQVPAAPADVTGTAASDQGSSDQMTPEEDAQAKAVIEAALIQAMQQQAQQQGAGGATAAQTPVAGSATTTHVSSSPASVAPPATLAVDSSSTQTIDPTLAFFMALSNCTPGQYSEKNILATEVGQPMLSQQILGPSDDQMTCNVTLSTPDNRTMSCQFPMDSLSQFSEQHFMQGILTDTTDDPDQDALNADLKWSQIKSDCCNLGY